MKHLIALIALVALVAASLGRLQATVLLQDNFPTDGSLVGTTPAVGGIWTTLSGTADTLVVSGNKLLIQDTKDQDAKSDFPSLQAVDLFVGFTLNMSATNITSTTVEYFSSFRSTTGYDGRILAVRPAGTAVGKYRLGISNTTEASVNWASDLDPGVDYRVVFKFTQNGANDFVTLWVGPASEASTSVSTAAAVINTGLSGFAFRQAAATGDMAIDQLVVGTTFSEAVPEPGTCALLGAGAIVLPWGLRRARRIKS